MIQGLKIAGGMLGTSVAATAIALSLTAMSGGFQAGLAAANPINAAGQVKGSPATPASFTSYMTPAGAVSETVSQVNRIINAKSYREVRREVVYYSHSKTRGWVKLPAPRVTTTVSTHTYK